MAFTLEAQEKVGERATKVAAFTGVDKAGAAAPEVYTFKVKVSDFAPAALVVPMLKLYVPAAKLFVPDKIKLTFVPGVTLLLLKEPLVPAGKPLAAKVIGLL